MGSLFRLHDRGQLEQARLDLVAHLDHAEAARVGLPVAPLLVADDGLGRPLVEAADGGGHGDH